MPRPALRDYIPHSLLVASACLALAANVYLLFPREGTQFIPIFAGSVATNLFACEVYVTSDTPWPKSASTWSLALLILATSGIISFAGFVTCLCTLETQRKSVFFFLIASAAAGGLMYIFAGQEVFFAEERTRQTAYGGRGGQGLKCAHIKGSVQSW
ncbi:hypothetical protein JCM10207_008343 [Rhodosporidiobolus poonsookiae]